MLEIKDKDNVRQNIRDALNAIHTLRAVFNRAVNQEDFLTLSLMHSPETLTAIAHSSYAALNGLPDGKPEKAITWVHWANIEFPEADVFNVLAFDMEWEISHSAKEV